MFRYILTTSLKGSFTKHIECVYIYLLRQGVEFSYLCNAGVQKVTDLGAFWILGNAQPVLDVAAPVN